MSKKIVITICTSASFYKEALGISQQLRKLGFKVIIPSTAYKMKRNKNFEISFYRTWLKNKADYHRKTSLMIGHFKKVLKSDAILVLNYRKNGLPGYIGGNVLMEMTVAFQAKKPIFVYDKISDKLGIAEEVYGLQPTFIDKKLEKILL